MHSVQLIYVARLHGVLTCSACHSLSLRRAQPGRGGGGGGGGAWGYLGLIFAGYVPLASGAPAPL